MRFRTLDRRWRDKDAILRAKWRERKPWFAWHPVYLWGSSGIYAWLEWVDCEYSGYDFIYYEIGNGTDLANK